MRLDSRFSIPPAIALALTSCSALRATDTSTIGRTQDIPVADIEAAVSAFKTATRPDVSIGEIKVISHDEIRIYVDGAGSSYTSMVRIKGKWQVGSVVLVHPLY
jgi:hypothetical protein